MSTDPTKLPGSDRLLRLVGWTVVACLLTLGLLAGASWFLHWEGFWRGAGQPYATALAALAAVIAAAIALHNSRSQLDELKSQRAQDQARYEEQREQDQVRWEDQRRRNLIQDLRTRFGEATTMLADDRATVRRSGCYAMAALADDWHSAGNDAERQIAVGVLCAYLTDPNPTFDEAGQHPGADGAVRETICKIISAHLSSEEDEHSWRTVRLDADRADLRRLILDALTLTGMTFWDANLAGARFVYANLVGVAFDGADLTECTFTDSDLTDASLNKATITGASLQGCDLTGTSFEHTVFSGVELSFAHFEKNNLLEADLSGALNLDRISAFIGIRRLDRVTLTDAQRDWLRCSAPGRPTAIGS